MLFWNVKDGKENIFDLDVFFLLILVQKMFLMGQLINYTYNE